MNHLLASDLMGRQLQSWTAARIALGRAGASMPTAANLDFSADHAAARDAVHTSFGAKELQGQLGAAGFDTVAVVSQAESRREYLRRPDLGRRLSAASVERLGCEAKRDSHHLTVVVADGLSAAAATRYAVPLMVELRAQLADWFFDTVVVAEQARVALGDEVGELRHAEAVLVLLGERPGLKTADSLGAYLTYAPRVGRVDAERNCVSNIRDGGLSISAAVTKLVYLLRGARALGRSGVVLKDNSELPALHNAEMQLDTHEWKGLLHATAELLER